MLTLTISINTYVENIRDNRDMCFVSYVVKNIIGRHDENYEVPQVDRFLAIRHIFGNRF